MAVSGSQYAGVGADLPCLYWNCRGDSQLDAQDASLKRFRVAAGSAGSGDQQSLQDRYVYVLQLLQVIDTNTLVDLVDTVVDMTEFHDLGARRGNEPAVGCATARR